MRIATILIAAAVLGACTQPAPTPAVAAVDTAAVKAAVDSIREHYRSAELAGDAAAVAALYHADGGIDVYGAPAMRGKDAIQAGMSAAWTAMGHPDMVDITPTATTPRGNDAAIELGTYHNMGKLKGKGTHEWGRYVISLHKDAGGVWKVGYLMAFADSTKTDK